MSNGSLFIECSTDQIRFSRDFLGSDEAWLWVGSGYSPLDNDDTRVRETRELMEKYYPYVPYGMRVGNKEEGEMRPLTLQDGYYTLNLSRWPVGAYRANLHTAPGVDSPFGSPLHPERRDQDYSWSFLENFRAKIRPFLHKEKKWRRVFYAFPHSSRSLHRAVW